jgi:D-inositol-3-phosphate glycosyltransferase
MACGTPVVGSAVGGLLDTVLPGSTGVLVPPGRPDRIAAAVQALLGDDQRRERMSRQCAAIAAERFDWRTIVARVASAYRTALDGAGEDAQWLGAGWHASAGRYAS